MVEGETTKNGIGNDLFDNTRSIKRIICPAKNSFRVYRKILNAILKVDKSYLVLISLGPTAAVLACDLSKLGYQAIDIGHANSQYKKFLKRKRKRQIYGKNDYNNTNENYNKQIIFKIFH